MTLQTDFTYDSVGNRTTRTVGGAAETYTMDAASNRLASVLAGGVTRSFTYSATGNVTVDDLGGAATNLTYNAADRLVQVSAGGITLVDYVYAATGQRAVKATPLATTHYLYDPGGALYAETDGAGTVMREYITLGGATIAIVDAGGVNYVHSDHLATPQVMTDGAAAVVWDASYRPFGEATIAGAAANAQRFPGQTADAETGYHDNWYRTYDPSLGRYLQSDPIGLAAGLNTYAYAGGNPVMYADPTGQFFWVVFFGTAVDAAGLGLTLYAVADFGLRWHDNYRAGGCTDFWGVRPEISPLDVAFLLAGPTVKAGKWAFSPAGRAALSGTGNKFKNFLADESGSFRLPPWGATKRSADGRLRNLDGTFAYGGGSRRVPNPVHGNTRTPDTQATLYGKFDADGNFLKWGKSQKPQTRYTSRELNDGFVKRYRTGSTDQILDRERRLIERFPGPENREPWAGVRRPK